MLKINFLTIFPNYYKPFVTESIIKRAIISKKVKIDIIDFRKFSSNKHMKVDDVTYGGGHGMLLMLEPIDKALESIKENTHIILLTPQGKKFTQAKAIELSKKKSITLIAGRYEGFDERIKELIDEEISIGDYVLTGGELPSMVIADSVIRLLPSVIKEASHQNDSFMNDVLDYPQYTKPQEYKGMKVPDVLLNGNHKLIDAWRKEQQLKNTKIKRPDLIKKGGKNEK